MDRTFRSHGSGYPTLRVSWPRNPANPVCFVDPAHDPTLASRQLLKYEAQRFAKNRLKCDIWKNIEQSVLAGFALRFWVSMTELFRRQAWLLALRQQRRAVKVFWWLESRDWSLVQCPWRLANTSLLTSAATAGIGVLLGVAA